MVRMFRQALVSIITAFAVISMGLPAAHIALATEYAQTDIDMLTDVDMLHVNAPDDPSGSERVGAKPLPVHVEGMTEHNETSSDGHNLPPCEGHPCVFTTMDFFRPDMPIARVESRLTLQRGASLVDLSRPDSLQRPPRI